MRRERLYPDTKKLEMYCRNKRNGWDSWGNEIENDVELLTNSSTLEGEQSEHLSPNKENKNNG